MKTREDGTTRLCDYGIDSAKMSWLEQRERNAPCQDSCRMSDTAKGLCYELSSPLLLSLSFGGVRNSIGNDWSRNLAEVGTEAQAIAQTGLAYSKDPYDVERFSELRAIAVEIVAE